MDDELRAEAAAWAQRAPHVPRHWFRRHSSLHGPAHTRRVHVHAQRLLGRLGWPEDDAVLTLCAALWHDIGRRGDGMEPEHGRLSAERVEELGLGAGLPPHEGAVVRFAVVRHSLPDHAAADEAARLAEHPDPARRLAQPERALRVLWLLKDADALDRVRLGFGERADPRQLRHAETVSLIPFAAALLRALP